MYLFFGILLLFLILCFFFNYFRRKKIRKKICHMDMEEKCFILNSLTEPFGYCYDMCSDLFSSTLDAWQKNFGYCRLYDETAPSMNMVFDCEPVYFNYNNRTWLIEFWKGQYGINTGAEVGIYHANSILKKYELPTALFFGVSESEMLPVSYELVNQDNDTVFRASKVHWWLACFRMGLLSNPSDLRLKVSISFADEEMKRSYINGLLNTGYSAEEIYVYHQTVSVCFSTPKSMQPLRRIRSAIANWQNRQFIRLYLSVTKPFCHTADRLLYLYYFAPGLFRSVFSSRGKYRRIYKKTVQKAKHFI